MHMKIDNILELYELLSQAGENSVKRSESIQMRKSALNKMQGLKKYAFDTRRINQETEYNPRRGLQNYHRSESFVTEAMSHKLAAFGKLNEVINQLKGQYSREPAWQDSYLRTLSSALNKGLRTDQLDGDFSDAQPSMASLDYLEELMYVRYRLTPDNIMSMGSLDIEKALLAKDEVLVRNGVSSNYVIAPREMQTHSYDHMMEKILFTVSQAMAAQKSSQDDLLNKLFNVKATKDSPEVERTVNITIKDSIKDTEKEVIKVAEESEE